MKIVITDTGILWNPWNPILKKYRDRVLVVCLEGIKATDEFECFICPRKSFGLGMSMGVGSIVYNNLDEVADEFYNRLRYEDDILFLTDGNPASLYPYIIMKNRKHNINIHLWASSPWSFEGKARIKTHRDMLSDLSGVKSVCYIDTQDFLKHKYKKFSDLLEDVKMYYDELLPIVIKGIDELKTESYFDLVSKSYIPLRKESQEMHKWHSMRYCLDNEESIDNIYFTEGLVYIPQYPISDKYTKNIMYKPVARIDGKKICNILREYRFKLAQMNNIDFSSEDCSYVGACAGTCEKCDEEAKYLSMKLSEIPKEKQRIPRLGLEEVE